MTATIYEQFDKATNGLSAYVIFDKSEPVGRVVFTYARSGMRTTCWLQIWGAPMVKAFANGCGYDKGTASFVNAAARINADELSREDRARVAEIVKGVTDNGRRWTDRLREAGLTVQHVIE